MLIYNPNKPTQACYDPKFIVWNDDQYLSKQKIHHSQSQKGQTLALFIPNLGTIL